MKYGQARHVLFCRFLKRATQVSPFICLFHTKASLFSSNFHVPRYACLTSDDWSTGKCELVIVIDFCNWWKQIRPQMKGSLLVVFCVGLPLSLNTITVNWLLCIVFVPTPYFSVTLWPMWQHLASQAHVGLWDTGSWWSLQKTHFKSCQKSLKAD